MTGRPRKFDSDEVLEAAMQCFWSKGYESTSLTDLVDATGLLKGSLYHAFGDKHSLFKQSLERYLANMRGAVRSKLAESERPVDGVCNALHCVIDIADADSRQPKGCMAINSLIERVPIDAEVRSIMLEHRRQVQKMFVDKLKAASAAGDVTQAREPEQTFSLLMTFVAGLAATMKGPTTKKEAHRLLDEQMAAVL